MTDRKLSALELATAVTGKAAIQKPAKLRNAQMMKDFAAALDQTVGQQARDEGQDRVAGAAITVPLSKFREANLAKAALRQQTTREPDAEGRTMGMRHSVEALPQQPESVGDAEPVPVEQADTHEPPRSEVANARLSTLFAGLLPGGQGQLASLHKPEQQSIAANSVDAADEAAALKPQATETKMKPAPVPEKAVEPSHAEEEAEAFKPVTPEARPILQANGRSDTGEADDTAPRIIAPVTVTKLETVLLPAGASWTAAVQKSVTTERTQAPLPATPAMPAGAAANVVRSIEFHLQPEELGEVRVSLHLRGDELRLAVEVTTHEAHALLQRDHKALRDVLEKAGYDVAEAAVAVTLRAESAPAQQSGSLAHEQNGQQRGGAGGQAPQHFADGQQSRQPARQAFREDDNGQVGHGTPREDSRSRPAGNIYL